MRVKPWAERLPLSELKGFLLFGCALRLMLEELKQRQIHHDDFLEKWAGLSRPAQFFADSLDRVNDVLTVVAAQCKQSLPDHKAAEQARIGDFVIFADQLFVRKALARFVLPQNSRRFRLGDGETPIFRNFELPLGEVESLFFYWADYFLSERQALPEEVLGWPCKQEHFHWLNYVAPHCEPPRGAHRPKGSNTKDATNNAASHAVDLYLAQIKSGGAGNMADAVRQARSHYDVFTQNNAPKDERTLANCLIGTTGKQVEKRITKAAAIMLQKMDENLDGLPIDPDLPPLAVVVPSGLA